jgi:DNA-binding transcriptional ArsR family regulator
MSEDEEISRVIDELVAAGALEIDGMYHDELTYRVNLNVMEEIFPEFFKVHMEEVDQTILSLYEKGLVDVEYDENLVARFSLTEKGEQVTDQLIMGHIDEIDGL